MDKNGHTPLGEAGLPLSAAVLAGLVVLFVGAGLVGTNGDLIGWARGDMAASYFHWREYGFGWMRRGVIPFWNPHTFMGNPFAANYEAALFYPLNAIFLILPTVWAMNISILLHLWLLGFFTMLLARRLGLGAAGTLVVAVVYTFSGSVLGRLYAGHISIVCAMAWWPALLWAVERLLDRPILRNVGIGAALYGMAVLAGHPQILYYASLLTLVYTALRLFTIAPDNRLRGAAGVIVFFALGAAIGAVQLLITWFAQMEGSRQQMTLESARTFSLSWQALAGFVVPGLFGDGVSGPYWGPWYRWEIAVYTGLGTMVLAMLGGIALLGGRISVPRAPFAILGAIGLLALIVAMGGMLHGVLYALLPGFDFFRGPAKVLGLIAIVPALMAGVGAQWLLAGIERRDGLLVGVCLATPLLLIGIAFLLFGGSDSVLAAAGRFAERGSNLELPLPVLQQQPVMDAILSSQQRDFALSVGLWLLATVAILLTAMGPARVRLAMAWGLPIVLAGELFLAHRSFVTTLDSATLREPVGVVEGGGWRTHSTPPHLSPNAAMTEGSYLVEGYEPVYTRLFGEFTNATHQRPRDVYDPLPSPRAGLPLFRLTGAGHDPLPRALVYTRWEVMGEEQLWQAIQSSDWNPADVAYVSSDTIPPAPESSGGSARVVSSAPNEVIVEVATNGPALLVLNETWAPGWRAERLDSYGRIDVLRVNHAFRGVYIDRVWSGEVRFHYRAPGFAQGLLVTLIAMVMALALLLVPASRDSESDEDRKDKS